MANVSTQADFVIGVDTHRDTHTAAVVDCTGAAHATTARGADPGGYQRLLAFARQQAPQRRVWAGEGSGSFGRGLTTYLLDQGEPVVEVDRPARPARRTGTKSDPLDAVRAAREVLARPHLAQPRQRGEREGVRVLLRTRQSAVDARRQALCQLKALVMTAPEPLRAALRTLTTGELVRRCAGLRPAPRQPRAPQATRLALRALARRAQALQAEAEALHVHLCVLVRAGALHLLTEPC